MSDSNANIWSKLKRGQDQHWRSHNNSRLRYPDIFLAKALAGLSRRHETKAFNVLRA